MIPYLRLILFTVHVGIGYAFKNINSATRWVTYLIIIRPLIKLKKYQKLKNYFHI